MKASASFARCPRVLAGGESSRSWDPRQLRELWDGSSLAPSMATHHLVTSHDGAVLGPAVCQ